MLRITTEETPGPQDYNGMLYRLVVSGGGMEPAGEELVSWLQWQEQKRVEEERDSKAFQAKARAKA